MQARLRCFFKRFGIKMLDYCLIWMRKWFYIFHLVDSLLTIKMIAGSFDLRMECWYVLNMFAQKRLVWFGYLDFKSFRYESKLSLRVAASDLAEDFIVLEVKFIRQAIMNKQRMMMDRILNVTNSNFWSIVLWKCLFVIWKIYLTNDLWIMRQFFGKLMQY